MNIKFYDTSSLLLKADSIFNNEEFFLISSITLHELEYIKNASNKDPDIKYAARHLLNELDKQFPNIGVNINYSLWQNFNRVYKKTGKRFMFVFDDWDFIMSSNRVSIEEKDEYLSFLAELFTDAEYVEMAYLTGKDSISRFTNNRYLDMFTEFELSYEDSNDRELVSSY